MTGRISVANDLWVTRISENVWHIEYLPTTGLNLECKLHLMESEDCVEINKHRVECTDIFNTEGPTPHTLPAFDLYFVRE